jgi:ribosomal protein S18 acetylase RimI-like enzyme
VPEDIEIRRIREADAPAVVDLWDRGAREVRDGGPLTGRGRRNLVRMLEISAWHRDTFCLVADRAGQFVGYAAGRVDAADGLLPGAVGRAEELYVPPDAEDAAAVRRSLADAVVAELRRRGVGTIRKEVAADEPEDQAFWTGLGFEADMVTLSLYQEGGCATP